MITVKQRDMKLGDVVECYKGPFSTAVVEKVTDNMVHLFRPYARANDVAYGDTVTCLTGVEHFSVWRDSDREFVLLQEGEVK
jgi:hypothetical protein